MARSALLLVVLVASCLTFAHGASLWAQLGTSGFNTLRTLLTANNLQSMFDTATTDPKYTVFAPTDAALAAFNTTGLTNQQIADTLAFHVVSGDVRSSALSNDMVVTDAAGKAKRFNIYGTKYTINGVVNIVIPGVDIVADNGVIHTVDKVITIPTMEESRTITAEVVANSAFSTLRAALIAASLTSVFDNISDPYTVFAPTDAAFAKLPAGLVGELVKPANLAVLQGILKYHVVQGTVYSAALSNNLAITTLQAGVTATVTLGTSAKINTATISPVDLTRRNGVIHVIDEVLVPSNVVLPTVPSQSPPPPADDSSASTLTAAFAALAALALLF